MFLIDNFVTFKFHGTFSFFVTPICSKFAKKNAIYMPVFPRKLFSWQEFRVLTKIEDEI